MAKQSTTPMQALPNEEDVKDNWHIECQGHEEQELNHDATGDLEEKRMALRYLRWGGYHKTASCDCYPACRIQKMNVRAHSIEDKYPQHRKPNYSP